MTYDVFISHSSDDKDDFVRPLAELLDEGGLTVWYDEFTLKPGDSLTSRIDEGLDCSRFGLVVLSPSFFKKEWTKREYRGLVSKLLANENRIIPIWHNVDSHDVRHFSPPLADTVAIRSADGIESVAERHLALIPPAERNWQAIMVEAERLLLDGHYASAIMNAAIVLQEAARNRAKKTLTVKYFKNEKLERFPLRELLRLLDKKGCIVLDDGEGNEVDWRWLINRRNEAVHNVEGKKITRRTARKYIDQVTMIRKWNGE